MRRTYLQQLAKSKDMRFIKLVTIGDKSVGKTSMLMSYVLKSFQSEYVPTVFGALATVTDCHRRPGARFLFLNRNKNEPHK